MTHTCRPTWNEPNPDRHIGWTCPTCHTTWWPHRTHQYHLPTHWPETAIHDTRHCHATYCGQPRSYTTTWHTTPPSTHYTRHSNTHTNPHNETNT